MKHHRQRFRSLLSSRLTWTIATVCLLLAVEAFGRAGGGGRYGGGGGGGGGSGGGGGGGDGLIVIVYFLIRLCIDAPIIGIPLCLIIVGVIIVGIAKGSKGAISRHQAGVISRGNKIQQAGEKNRALAAIVDRDPNFDETALAERINKAFIKVQEAWCAQNLGPMRPFVTDGIFERFSLQIREIKARGLVNRMDNLQVLSVVLSEAQSDENFDTVTYRITASAVDMEVEKDSGRVLTGSKRQEEFTEYWTFIRRPGAESITAGGLMEGNCPNCGAGLETGETAKCDSCGALVKSGQYDWVLSEITQACEWQSRPARAIPGAADLRTTDPAFSVQHLEDRTSVVFWRLITSLREGRIAPIRKMATESFCADLSQELAGDDKGIRRYPGHCAVGSVETKGIILGQPMDKAVVEIRWSGFLTEENSEGKTRQTNSAQIRTEAFVLERRHGTKGKDDFALASAHCPSCGGATHESASDACEYCGTVLNDGAADWVLMTRKSLYDAEIQALMEQFSPVSEPSHGAASPFAGSGPSSAASRPGSNLEQAAWMVGVMVSDGTVDDKERELLQTFATRRGLTSQQIDALIESAMADDLEAPVPETQEETRQWLEAMAEVALADGSINKAERAALMALGEHVGYSAYDINQIILRKRGQMYNAFRDQLRATKNRSTR